MLKSFVSGHEEERRARQAGRLPPGYSVTNKYPEMHYGPVPNADLATWMFRVFGPVARERSWESKSFKE